MPNAAGFDRRTIIAKGSALDMRGAGAKREEILFRGSDKKR